MKKIINAVANVEEEMILGLVKSAPDKLRKLDCGNVVVRARKKEGKVALISGGGSGHCSWRLCGRGHAGWRSGRCRIYFSYS